MSIEDVTENLMGIDLPQWSKRRKGMYKAAEEYFGVLNEMKTISNSEQLDGLRNRLDELSKPFASNVTAITP